MRNDFRHENVFGDSELLVSECDLVNACKHDRVALNECQGHDDLRVWLLYVNKMRTGLNVYMGTGGIFKHTQDAHENCRLSRRNTQQNRNDLIQHKPLVHVIHQLADAHQTVDSHLPKVANKSKVRTHRTVDDPRTVMTH